MTLKPKLEQILASEFISLALPPVPQNIDVKYKNYEVIGDVVLNGTNASYRGAVYFENILFKGKLIISYYSFNKPVEFHDCSFRSEFTIENCSLENLKVLGCEFHKAALLTAWKSSGEGIFFSDCSVKKLHIHTGQHYRDIVVRRSKIDDELTLEGAAVDELTIDWSRMKSVTINVTAQKILMHYTLFCEFYLKGGVERLMFYKVRSINMIDLGESNILEIIASQVSGKSNLYFYNPTIKKSSIQNSSFHGLLFRQNIIAGRIIFQKISAQILEFDKVEVESENLRFEEVTLQEKGYLNIKGSDLGNTSFIRCDFSHAFCFFENAKINEVFLAETDFPNNVFEKDFIVNHDQAQLMFGQLQTAFSKQGDNIRSNEYQSKETEAYYRSIPWFYKTPDDATLLSTPNFSKVSLFLNYISNDFGRSWERGVLFTCAGGVILFIFLVWSTPEYQIGLSWDHEMFGSFLRFMNPLRQFNLKETFDGKTLGFTSLSYLCDFLGRIFVAYGYYQTIQAFRRYGKK